MRSSFARVFCFGSIGLSPDVQFLTDELVAKGSSLFHPLVPFFHFLHLLFQMYLIIVWLDFEISCSRFDQICIKHVR